MKWVSEKGSESCQRVPLRVVIEEYVKSKESIGQDDIELEHLANIHVFRHWKILKRHPASRTFLLLARFWRSRERLCMNRVTSLLNMRCMLPGYSLKPKPNMPDLAAILVFHGTAGSIITTFCH